MLVHGMSKADIQDVIAAFAQAARDAQAIGMDGWRSTAPTAT